MVRIASLPIVELEPIYSAVEIEGKATLIEMHSVLNALNVLKGSLILIGYELEPAPDCLLEAQAYCESVCSVLSDKNAVNGELAGITGKLEWIAQALDRIEMQMGHPHPRDFDECRDNIMDVCRILNQRVAEIILRAAAPLDWQLYEISSLQSELEDFFRVVAKFSRGRYRIAFQPEQKSVTDYLIKIRIESYRDDSFSMPALFKDVVRDLMANARKYTKPGGIIEASLIETPKSVYFRVEDTGIGIPLDELSTICLFGTRGSNVQSHPTMGGGFGLTKALHVTKTLNGHFYIASRLNYGTRIRIEIPKL